MSLPAVGADTSAPDGRAKERIKVVHIINGDLFAGAERVQDLLAERLPEFGYEISFACLKEGDFQQQLQSGNRHVRTFVMRSRFDLLRTALQVAKWVRTCEGRLIHTHTVRGALIGSCVAALTGLPMVHHIHSPTARDTSDRWSNRINALVERASLMRAGMLLPVSDSLASYLLLQGHKAGRINTVCNGVPIGELRAPTDPGRPLTLGMVALFRQRKGIEVLLYSMAQLIAQGQMVRLRAVGTFETHAHEQAVLALSRKLGVSEHIEWRGFRSDVLDELGHMDVLVLPSLFGEGLPMVLLEAMAVGLPVVASAVEGIPEAIREGSEGLLVPPGNSVALAAALMNLAKNPGLARRMGLAGRLRQREMFSDAAMAGHVSRIYDRMLAAGA